MSARSESRLLETTADVMSALGGASAVSALTGARYKTVWPWGDAATFPSRYYVVMTWALRRKRLRAPPSLWDQVTVPGMEKEAA